MLTASWQQLRIHLRNWVSGFYFKSVQIGDRMKGTGFSFISPTLLFYFQKIPILLLIKQKEGMKKKSVGKNGAHIHWMPGLYQENNKY